MVKLVVYYETHYENDKIRKRRLKKYQKRENDSIKPTTVYWTANHILHLLRLKSMTKVWNLQVYIKEINMKNYIMRDKIKTIVKLYKVSINWSFWLFW